MKEEGQIAHLDRDPSNVDEENLAYLCLDHHARYDSRSDQTLRFRKEEAKHARDELCARIKEGLFGNVGVPTGSKLIKVVVTVKGSFESFEKADREELLECIKHLSQIEGHVTMVRFEPGSTKLTLKLSEEDAERLLSAADAGHLADLDVVDVRLPESKALLVIVGALGDWCIRRVLRDAGGCLMEHGGHHGILANIVLVDKHDATEVEKSIALRLIQQTAELMDSPTVLSDDPKSGYRLLCDPESGGEPRGLSDGIVLPDPRQLRYRGAESPASAAIDDFCDRYVDKSGLEKACAAVSEIRENPTEPMRQLKKKASFKDDLEKDFERLRKWALEPVELTFRTGGTSKKGDPGRTRLVGRYWKTIGEDDPCFEVSQVHAALPVITVEDVKMLAQNYRIIVYVATPPQAYPLVIHQWAPYAERIALEKPISGLMTPDSGRLRLALTSSDTLKSVGTEIRKTASNRARAHMAPVQVVTIDHYTSKWALHAIDIAKQRRVIDHILAHPQLVLVQVCESEVLSSGRFHFYNSVGGAFSDMVAHLMQPLRAIAGYGSVAEMLDHLRVLKIRRAQYEIDGSMRAKRDRPFSGDYDEKDADTRLITDTETFAAAELQFISGPWTGVKVLVRTGKGVLPESKILRVYGPDDGEGTATVTFDISGKALELGIVNKDQDAMRLRPWMKGERFKIEVDGVDVTQPSDEYGLIFSRLCGLAELDPRYFPPVSEAAKAYDFFRTILVRERFAGSLNAQYEPYSTYPFLNFSELGCEDVVAWRDGLFKTVPVAIFLPDVDPRGDLASAEAFRDAVETFMDDFGFEPRPGATPTVILGSWFTFMKYVPRGAQSLSQVADVFKKMRGALLSGGQLDDVQNVAAILTEIAKFEDVSLVIGTTILVKRGSRVCVKPISSKLSEALKEDPGLLRKLDALWDIVDTAPEDSDASTTDRLDPPHPETQ